MTANELASHAQSPSPVGLSWLTRVRWTTMAAGAGAVVAGHQALDIDPPVVVLAFVFAAWLASNVWLTWRLRHAGDPPVGLAGALASADVMVLSVLLFLSGGILNPASVFYLVEIVMAALVLGRRWTWGITALSVAGYASLYAVPSSELSAAVGMHREIGLHMRGMWLAFALTAFIIAVLVTRLAMAIERRDRALDVLREQTARSARAAGLATLAAGAAHELSTPLATIAVTARELERRLADPALDAELGEDARLIRKETDRCRQVLEAMAGDSGQPMGELPKTATLDGVLAAVVSRLSAGDRERTDVAVPAGILVNWPTNVLVRAIGNVVQNACHASPAGARVSVNGSAMSGRVRVVVTDSGPGLLPDDLARVGEPFYTTKPAGKGTGLGVFVARSSVEQLGGSLTLTSSSGRGTSVQIDLPADVVAGASRV